MNDLYFDDGGQRVQGFTPDLAESLDSIADQWAEETKGMNAAQAARWCAKKHEELSKGEQQTDSAIKLLRIVGELIAPGNIALRIECLAIASNLSALNGIKSQTEVAKKHGVTRAAVSKNVIKWQSLLNLPKSPFQKTEKARESYRKVATEKHWRKRQSPILNLFKKHNQKALCNS